MRQKGAIPVAPGLQMISDGEPSYDQEMLSMYGLFESHCVSWGKEATFPLIRGRMLVEEELCKVFLSDSLEDQETVAEKAISEGCRKAFMAGCDAAEENLLRRIIMQRSSTMSTFSAVRRILSLQMGVHMALQLLLHCCNSLYPHMLLLSLTEGTISCRGMKPAYTFLDLSVRGSSCLETPKPFPFRLTRNLADAIGKLYLTGPCTAALGCALNAIVSNRNIIEVRIISLICHILHALRSIFVGSLHFVCTLRIPCWTLSSLRPTLLARIYYYFHK